MGLAHLLKAAADCLRSCHVLPLHVATIISLHTVHLCTLVPICTHLERSWFKEHAHLTVQQILQVAIFTLVPRGWILTLERALREAERGQKRQVVDMREWICLSTLEQHFWLPTQFPELWRMRAPGSEVREEAQTCGLWAGGLRWSLLSCRLFLFSYWTWRGIWNNLMFSEGSVLRVNFLQKAKRYILLLKTTDFCLSVGP